MNKILSALIMCLTITIAYTQTDKYIYLDSLGRETVPGKHKSYKIIKDFYETRKSYIIQVYYTSGKIKSEGLYSDNKGRVQEGYFIKYYENGIMKSREMYTENLAYGDFSSWHENGNKKVEGEYIIDNYSKPVISYLKINNAWNADNIQEVINGNGFHNEISDLEVSKGEIVNGYKNGQWEGTSRIGNLTFTEIYENGKLREGTASDSLGSTYQYTEVEKQAAPKEGLQNFYKSFASRFNPPSLPAYQKEVRVLLQFIIDKDGEITEIETVRSDNPKVEKSAKKVLSKMEKWTPAYHRGKALKSQFTLPVTINAN